MRLLTLVLILSFSKTIMAQDTGELPYYEIPEAAESYTAGTVVSRMIDGLGFRYYWATEGLRPEDLAYKASTSGRTSEDTIEHLYGLSNFILSSIIKDFKAVDGEEMTFEEKRKQTLLNFKTASDILRATEDISKFDNNRYPFWNVINGPIADALWHCGQIVMLRRASGNPFNSKVSVFTGKLRD
ncbi:hypothetical protein SAMN05421824_2531 [Hyunsoonleella jejuensis]|uniref:DinB superfamily protein n=1 Tax=Hyunsoonleella jejuensis TaxID=419940 RepID=A0A1H9JHQ3_9FLAO|nr:hypothetical protein [Hyunsoonleella jejuensis]SEQ86392.1 hypothetical protein SAMN05421824_2531 [Hyunsoonleella jejuensis]